jgi:hypothetical protein
VTTLFDNTNTSTQTTQVDETKNYLEELVGEGKKFKTPQELARGKAEADAFVERLKQEQQALREENARLQQEASSKNRLSDLLDRLEKEPGTTTTTSQTTTSGEPDGSKQVITPEKIAEIIDQRVSQREKLLIEANNLQYVKNTLTETFGPNYSETLKSKAQELSVGTEFLDSLARAQPKAFLELVGVKAGAQQATRTSPTGGAPASSTNTQAFTKTNVSTDRTMSYYDKIKTASPKEYWSPKVQNQMHNDALRLGPQFFDSP